MPDDMLEDAIMISKKSLDEHDFETEGVEVTLLILESITNSNLKYRLQRK